MWDTKKCVRDMEHWTRDHGGFQAYYTDLFCTHREFRQMFDHTLVDKARERFNATDAFPEVTYILLRLLIFDINCIL